MRVLNRGAALMGLVDFSSAYDAYEACQRTQGYMFDRREPKARLRVTYTKFTR